MYPVRVKVWIAGWQMQSCHTPFAVGEKVEWTLYRLSDSQWLEYLLGADLGKRIEFAEGNHGQLPSDTPVTQASVADIHAVRTRYAARPGESPIVRYPVPGTATLTKVTSADGWETETNEMTFTGYIVDLDIPN